MISSSTQKKTATSYIDLGLIDYDAAYAKQQQCHQRCLNNGESNVLVCEHPPVITCGRMSHDENFIIPKEEILAKGVTIRNIDRGGDLTLHAPGQLVVYPILNLNEFGRDLHKYLHLLEEVGLSVLNDFGIKAQRDSVSTGVWTQGKKIISIGIGVKKWVSYHGMSINVSTDLELFSLIKPCGLNAQMITLEKQLGRPVEMREVKEKLKHQLSRVFEFEWRNEEVRKRT